MKNNKFISIIQKTKNFYHLNHYLLYLLYTIHQIDFRHEKYFTNLPFNTF